MQAYNIYVKRKEKEMLELIDTLNSRNSNNNLLDYKLKNLEHTVGKLGRESMEFEKLKEGLRAQIKNWKQKFEVEKTEKDFFHKQALEAKRKNKLLKIAVGRLQNEYDRLKDKYNISESELQFVT